MRWIVLMILFLTSACLGACLGKAYTKPRSEILRENAHDVDVNAALSAERSRFLAAQAAERDRLEDLLAMRLGATAKADEYRLGPGDEVEVHVFDVPELDLVAKVTEGGFITLPLVGALPVAGAKLADARTSLAGRLLQFVKEPQVTMLVSSFGSQKVAVLGAVRKPGLYSLRKGRTGLLEVLSEAGGLSAKAGNILEFVPAEASGMNAAGDVDARARFALSKATNPSVVLYVDEVLGGGKGIPVDIPLRGGDMVVVPEGGTVLVEGEVEKPGSFELGNRMSLLAALAAAGGITYGAKIDEVEVVREVAIGDRASFVLNLEQIATGGTQDVRLRNGDIVRVPSDSARRLRQDTFQSIARVLNVGVGGHVELRQ